MNKQPEALRLAAVAIFDRNIGWQSDATVELRRQHAEIVALKAQRDELLKALRPFAETDLTNPTVRDTFGFDVLFARAAIANATGGAA